MSIGIRDREILRELGKKYAEVAMLEKQQATINNWKQINQLNSVKPMVMIAQIPWHEMNINEELTLRCEDNFCRSLEDQLRKALYKWNHMETDMVFMPYIGIPKIIRSTGTGIVINEETKSVDKNNDVVAHKYLDQIQDKEDLAKIHEPIITFDEEQTAYNERRAQEIFEGILPTKRIGAGLEFRVWDQLAMYRGVTPLLMDMIDRPEFIHEIMEKFTQIQISILKQYEKLNLLEEEIQTIHCSGAFVDELPSKQFDGKHVTGKDCWAYGMGQIFSSCSPQMHEEFEIEYAKRYYEHCGLVYYGCCEPLDNKIDIIRKIPNVRKISISPWANVERASENIQKDYVLSRKPNPAFLATQTLDEEQVKKEIIATLKACEMNGTPCEFILKDISTVNYQPEKLFRWSQLVKSIIENY